MRKGLTGNLNSSLITTYKKVNEYRNIQRRKVLSGYPVKKTFESRQEIDEYMSGDRITCLLCGRSYKALGCHLKIHGMTSDQYKIEYGLPMSVGLDNQEIVERKSKQFKKMIADGIILSDKKEVDYYRKLAQKSTKFSVRQPFRKKVDADKLNKHLKKDYDKDLKKFDDSYYINVLTISKMMDIHPFDVCDGNKGYLPSSSMLRAKNRENKDIKKLFLKTIDNLPFIVQAAHQMLGLRFIQEVRRLTFENYSIDEMVNYLQVNKQSIVNCRTKYNIKPVLSDRCHRGHKYENENRKCFKCATLNRRDKGVLPMEVARYTIVDKKCGKCGLDIKAKRMGKAYCDKCKEDAYYESQRKYAMENKERRKEMNRAAALKRKQKIK